MSDIKVSNPLTIDETRRVITYYYLMIILLIFQTESGQMKKIKVSENSFQASMRQASEVFKASDVKAHKNMTGSGQMQEIMEVEDSP